MEISLEQYNKMAERLAELEYKEAERRWIPVTERLPEELQVVITSADGYVTLGHYCVLDKACWYNASDGYPMFGTEQPEAWMPLPEPYKGEQDETRCISETP